MLPQQQFATHVASIIQADDKVIGLAAAGSWITNELDEYSDIDLVLVTKEKIGGDREKMTNYARSFGRFLSGFTGEHVGEPRLLICLYDEPLLHVDIKFVTLQEFAERIETPVILFDRDDQLKKVLQSSQAKFPAPDPQWIEDRFWTWVHYGTVKVGRGEHFEAMDFLGFVRMIVLGPMLHLSYGNLPRGVRKIEKSVSSSDLDLLKQTIGGHDAQELVRAIRNTVALYKKLRDAVFPKEVKYQIKTEKRVLEYLDEVERKLMR